MKKVILYCLTCLVLVATLTLAIYGTFYVAKHVSYRWWYQDMVQETVREMVKQESLK